MFQNNIFFFALGFLFVFSSVSAKDLFVDEKAAKEDLQCFEKGECVNSLHVGSVSAEDEVI